MESQFLNLNGTNFQNGRFINVDEVHNNTKNMTLSGFNQESGTVTSNIENLTINPYDENYEVKLVKNNGESFVRVYTVSKTNKASAWFMREDDIIGLTPEEIKDKFALPYTPTHVVDVKIGNIIIRTGVVKEVDGW